MWAHVIVIGEFYRRRRGESAGASSRRGGAGCLVYPFGSGGVLARPAPLAAPGPSIHQLAAMLALELMTEAQSL